jgi:uncharacterized protein (TIGR02145 family)
VLNCPGPSIQVSVTVNPNPVVSFSICNDTITTISAKPFLLGGGSPYGGTFSGPGVDAGTGNFTPALAGIGIAYINYSYPNIYGCISGITRTIRVLADQPFVCGGMLSDVRDGHQYATFHLPNGKCWMKENLDFGNMIQVFVPQTDNCTPETYKNSGNSGPDVTSFYQWNELMRYEAVPGSQGLCPPGWHVPTSAEWEELLDYNFGVGKAGGPMKDLYSANGFHAIPDGFNYLNQVWSFTEMPEAGTFFWTSSSPGPKIAFARGLNNMNQSVSLYAGSRANAFSVRCIRD